MVEKFDIAKFEKDLIQEVVGLQDKLSKKYGVRFSLDVSWHIKDNVPHDIMAW